MIFCLCLEIIMSSFSLGWRMATGPLFLDIQCHRYCVWIPLAISTWTDGLSKYNNSDQLWFEFIRHGQHFDFVEYPKCWHLLMGNDWFVCCWIHWSNELKRIDCCQESNSIIFIYSHSNMLDSGRIYKCLCYLVIYTEETLFYSNIAI